MQKATPVLAAQGHEKISTAAIAKAARVCAGTFYLYFGSKEELLVELFKGNIERTWDDAFTLVRTRDTLVEQLSCLLANTTAGHDRDPALSRIFFREILFMQPPVLAAASDFAASVLYRRPSSRVAGPQRIRCRGRPSIARSCRLRSWFQSMLRHYSGAVTADMLARRLIKAIRMIVTAMCPVRLERVSPCAAATACRLSTA
ncbi:MULTISPECIES: TetR/AcrR family transcriptional regulator [unclassified Bradyrhizobium]|uniref:TetR/AcrR family transcriptional regulator n=1 Tax=unclassified Bradyrhizobium TaxID=2631580 RepID=UPI001BD09579|nr:MULTISPECIES: TetR/AcrR family transcriptional regulator [unclassified Bradyrhizobium]WOH52656.1 helix-turn-helix domain-containing protein [Bradyrhizobium sp. sBnM-33]